MSIDFFVVVEIQTYKNDENNLIELLHEVKTFVGKLSKDPHVVVGTVPQQIREYTKLLFDIVTKDTQIKKVFMIYCFEVLFYKNCRLFCV